LIGAGFTAVVAITVAFVIDYYSLMEDHSGLELVLGPGEAAIHLALDGKLTITIALIALFAKMIATLATIGSGGSAGLLVPSLFFGTMVAAAFADLFAIPAQMLVIPAMTATLVAIVNVPLAAILFTVEVFGSIYMVPALIALVVTSILAHDNTVYRTQREATSKRQILPGASVRRVPIPAKWENHTLVDLDFRKQFDLNVIGLVEQQGEDGRPHIRLGSAATVVLQQGDILVVLGSDENLDALETAVKEEQGSRGTEERGSRGAEGRGSDA
jgi:CIC family chloride channel protein